MQEKKKLKEENVKILTRKPKEKLKKERRNEKEEN